eukprot:CAMPEP_0205805206 /NCGR_PEP_ID=MMETSP0205-20121125/8351_1 /ASSEMBLY_ACC=CAM_ASM_000278 /TAXON_ID=36767 /ORGANISM="Euplotes focardii, Strain TN1" /LENGTH=83 /DNA_ID=CAMNT_0053076035 /DNA_START=1 /DNA_END=252 /DNA_ORIENTATION=+
MIFNFFFIKMEGKTSGKKIHFNEEEVKDHEEGHIIKKASDKFVRVDSSDLNVGDEIDKRLEEANKNAEENEHMTKNEDKIPKE